MKRFNILLVTILAGLFSSCSGSFQNMNSDMLTTALGQAITGLTLSDDQVIAMSQQLVHQMDSIAPVAGPSNPYAQRLNKLLGPSPTVAGITFDIKVYLEDEVNAFSTANGSIRVYQGLMDRMTDEELMGVIGHEIGHIMNNDAANGMRRAYQIAAGRTAVAATGNTANLIAGSLAGDLAELGLNSQFSQKQEYAADDYGLLFLQANGFNPYAMADALAKLDSLGDQMGALGKAVQFFSTHPDSKKRSIRIRQRAEADAKSSK